MSFPSLSLITRFRKFCGLLFTPPTPNSLPTPLSHRIFLTFLSFLSGCLLIIQAGCNVRNSSVLGHYFRGSLCSNVGGSLIILILAIGSGQFNKAFKRYKWGIGKVHTETLSTSNTTNPSSSAFSSSSPCFSSFFSSFTRVSYFFRHFHHYFGGLLGALYVLLSIYCVSTVGFSVFFLFCITGQIGTSCYMDQAGHLDYPKRPMNKFKWSGIILTMSGALLAQDYQQTNTSSSTSSLIVGILLATLSGIFLPIQAGVNKQYLLYRLDSSLPFMATLFSYFISIMFMLLLNVVILIFYRTSYPLSFDEDHAVWWQWVGGLLGSVYVFLAVVTPPVLGIAPYFVSVIAGQLLMSTLADSIGLFAAPKSYAYSGMGISGVLISFLGAILIALAKGKEHQNKIANPNNGIKSEEGNSALEGVKGDELAEWKENEVVVHTEKEREKNDLACWKLIHQNSPSLGENCMESVIELGAYKDETEKENVELEELEAI
jgi:uncharacterized membrane protein YdcZ (DUF606 family)